MSKEWWAWPGSFGAPWWTMAGARARFFEGGEVRLAILSLLADGPRNGYQIMKEMKERSGGMYRASAGSVYPTLQMLEDEGLIEAEVRDSRRLFRLTAAGRSELDRDPEAVRRIWERAERWEDWGQCMGPEVFAFAGSLGVLMRSTMRAAKSTAGRPERDAKLRELIQRVCHDLDEFAKE
jgi:DNA-binding PadR family transcriptional regulator